MLKAKNKRLTRNNIKLSNNFKKLKSLTQETDRDTKIDNTIRPSQVVPQDQ